MDMAYASEAPLRAPPRSWDVAHTSSRPGDGTVSLGVRTKLIWVGCNGCPIVDGMSTPYVHKFSWYVIRAYRIPLSTTRGLYECLLLFAYGSRWSFIVQHIVYSCS